MIADVEVIIGEPAAVRAEDAVIGIGGGELGHDGAKGRALLHALEDEVDAVPLRPFQPAQPRQDVVFFPYPFPRPLDAHAVIPRKSLHPTVVGVGPLAQHLGGNGLVAQDVPEEIHCVFWA